jgi:hypothetical protein
MFTGHLVRARKTLSDPAAEKSGRFDRSVERISHSKGTIFMASTFCRDGAFPREPPTTFNVPPPEVGKRDHRPDMDVAGSRPRKPTAMSLPLLPLPFSGIWQRLRLYGGR